MAVRLMLGRSEAMFDDDRYPDVPDDIPGSVVELGPFDYVELTYEMLRVGPEGEEIGGFMNGLWWLSGDPYPFSDLDIYAA